MGQAALDLPDPLQSPPDGVRTSTDELLARLAGEEIDRLLSEADDGAPRAAATPFHVGPPTSPEKDVVADVTGEAPPAEPAVPSEPSVVEQEVAAELDALFSAAVQKDNARAAADEVDVETSTAERAGLSTVADFAPLRANVVEDDAPLPLYLRPLEWLSAPLSVFPPGVRDLVGKAAIVTLLNAVAILAYVLIVRRE